MNRLVRTLAALAILGALSPLSVNSAFGFPTGPCNG
jgi:hypothetical protein